MKYLRDKDEISIEISQGKEWNVHWNILGIRMKYPLKAQKCSYESALWNRQTIEWNALPMTYERKPGKLMKEIHRHNNETFHWTTKHYKQLPAVSSGHLSGFYHKKWLPLVGKYCFGMAMAKLSIGKCQHSIWHHQQSTMFLSQPPSTTPLQPHQHHPLQHCHSQPPLTTYHHSTHPPMETWHAMSLAPTTRMAADNEEHPRMKDTHQQQCGNATSLAPTTTRTATDNKECPRTNTPTNGNVAMPHHSPLWWPELLQAMKNAQEWTQTMASTYAQTQATTHQGEPAHFPPPPLFFSLTQNAGATLLSVLWQPNGKQKPRFVVHCCC